MGLRKASVCECAQCGTMFRWEGVFVLDLCAVCEASMCVDACPESAEQVCALDAAAAACLDASDRHGLREVV